MSLEAGPAMASERTLACFCLAGVFGWKVSMLNCTRLRRSRFRAGFEPGRGHEVKNRRSWRGDDCLAFNFGPSDFSVGTWYAVARRFEREHGDGQYRVVQT